MMQREITPWAPLVSIQTWIAWFPKHVGATAVSTVGKTKSLFLYRMFWGVGGGGDTKPEKQLHILYMGKN